MDWKKAFLLILWYITLNNVFSKPLKKTQGHIYEFVNMAEKVPFLQIRTCIIDTKWNELLQKEDRKPKHL